MRERSELIAWIRGELVGPARPLTDPVLVEFADREFTDLVPSRRGPIAWRATPNGEIQEVLYYDRESPHRKYGAGLLHPAATPAAASTPDQTALQASDTVGAELEPDETSEVATAEPEDEESQETIEPGQLPAGAGADDSDDFEVTSPDVRHPSTIGVSFCAELGIDGQVAVQLPQSRSFVWQSEGAAAFPVNGRYEAGTRRWTSEEGQPKDAPVWRRLPAVLPESEVLIARAELVSGQVLRRDVTMPAGSPLRLRVEVFPRQIEGQQNTWLLTVVLRNCTDVSGAHEPREAVLYQTFFEIKLLNGSLQKYPESRRPFTQLDPEEQSLALLYREAATWGIGHGCAAGWDAEPGQVPRSLYADVFPAVELPSMTPDIEVQGAPVQLSMRALAALSDGGTGEAWQSLEDLAEGYSAWIQLRRNEVSDLPPQLVPVANRHLSLCE